MNDREIDGKIIVLKCKSEEELCVNYTEVICFSVQTV